MTETVEQMWERELVYEREQIAAAKTVFAEYAEALRYCWHFGDGDGGALLEWMRDAIGAAPHVHQTTRYRKRVLSARTRRTVMERDTYRCQHCGGWEDLTVDHVIAEANGGSDDLENLQTLCRPCNSRKGTS